MEEKLYKLGDLVMMVSGALGVIVGRDGDAWLVLAGDELLRGDVVGVCAPVEEERCPRAS